jgi:hypothetical protein
MLKQAAHPAILFYYQKVYNMPILDKLSENTKPEKSGAHIKGLMTRKSAKIPILGQPFE